MGMYVKIFCFRNHSINRAFNYDEQPTISMYLDDYSGRQFSKFSVVYALKKLHSLFIRKYLPGAILQLNGRI